MPDESQRQMDEDLAAHLAGQGTVTIAPILIAAVDSADGWVRVWSGAGILTWNGADYLGVGILGGISRGEETTEARAQGLVLSMSGILEEMISYAAEAAQPGRAARVWVGAMDRTRALIGEPYLWWDGETDVVSSEDSATTSTVAIGVEDKLIDLKRSRVEYYTTESQRHIDAEDVGYEYVPSYQDAIITFGRS